MTQSCAPLLGVSRESTVSVRVVRGLADALEVSGVPATELLRAAQLGPEQLESSDIRLPRWEVYRLCELAMDLADDPAFGLHWAEHLSGNTFVPISHLIAHAPTLRHAFDALSHFQRLISDRYGYELTESSDRVTVRCLDLYGASPRMQRFTAEMITMGVIRLLRMYSPRAQPERVCFAYSAPSYHAEYARLFERAPQFDQPFTGVVFDRALMSRPSQHKDEDLHEALCSIAERRVVNLTQRTSYAQRVHEYLVQHDPRTSDMSTVARALGMSVRSLRRRLADEGKSYHDVAHDALASVAKRLLLEQRHSIQETAYELGFAEPATFHRAFKRWTGMTPNEYRSRGCR
ncbi:MAG TPA: AraC family transcriptional regulator [Polyangiales bacterium]|nr:AraC family transcriptional regulator [Polyangiales bacterium]